MRKKKLEFFFLEFWNENLVSELLEPKDHTEFLDSNDTQQVLSMMPLKGDTVGLS